MERQLADQHDTDDGPAALVELEALGGGNPEVPCEWLDDLGEPCMIVLHQDNDVNPLDDLIAQGQSL